MNPYGSYRRLRDNAIAALVGAIEIYNKPRFAYRDECSVILMINAWELILKATLSKNRVSIYYPKQRNEHYRTVGWTDAVRTLNRERKWPSSLAASQYGMIMNVRHLADYRDAAVHFYNAPDFGLVVHSLAQQSVVNFRDYLKAAFGLELADEITWALMPLGTVPPVDPITYLRRAGGPAPSAAVRNFLDSLEGSVSLLNETKADASRLMTSLPVQLVSTKKAQDAAAVVGVSGESQETARSIVRRLDPNQSHPLSTTEVIERVGIDASGRRLTTNTFYAVVHDQGLREKAQLYYKPKAGSPQWAPEVVTVIKGLTAKQIVDACTAWRERNRRRATDRLSVDT